MKRTASRQQTLPAFRVTVEQAEALERELRALFQGDVTSHFSVTLGADEYEFETADEIRQAASTLPAVVHDFSLWVSARGAQEHCYVSISVSGRPHVSVQASDYGWCAAVVATCQRATERNKRWYSSLRSWHFWVLATAAGVFPAALSGPFKGSSLVASSIAVVAWLLLVALLWVIFFAFGRVFPPASLVIRREEPWAKRRAPELTLVLSLAALVVAVLTFLLK